MSRVQIGLSQNASDWIRRVSQGRGWRRKLRAARALRLRDVRLSIPDIKNRATGKSMGEHCEEMAREWRIGRLDQDALALQSHQRTVAAQKSGFFDDLLTPLDGVAKDAFPGRTRRSKGSPRCGPRSTPAGATARSPPGTAPR